MSDEVTVIPSIVSATLQYGALGIICAYFIWTDWRTRQDDKLKEAAALAREEERDRKQEEREASREAASVKRELDCIDRVRVLEARQVREIQQTTNTTNAVLRELAHAMRESGFKTHTPLPEIVNVSDAETALIRRKEG